MVNYHDPHTIARDFMALEDFHHMLLGLFVWEFFNTLDFELDVIRGRRPYRRSIWVYSLARVATLSTVVSEMSGLDITTRINCQAWGTLAILFPNTAFAAASLLIVYRIMAIWREEKIIILIAKGVWVADLAFLIIGCVRLRNTWSNESNSCDFVNPESTRPNIIGSLIADVLLLLIMLIGLLRMFIEGETYDLPRILWKQGLIWLLVALVAEIPSTVFVCLNLNVPMSYIFQAPNTITMTIAATRMYRSLMDLGSSEISQDSLRDCRHTLSKMRVRSGPIPLSQMETVLTETDQSPKSQTCASSSYISTDPVKGEWAKHVVVTPDAEDE